MEIERRERDPDTGEITPSLVGEGFGDVIGKIAAKLTGKTASKLATKAAEKLVEKGAEKIGEKLANLWEKRFMINFHKAKHGERSAQGSNRSVFAGRSSPRNKRKRNWEDACGFIPSCRSEAKTSRSRKSNGAHI